MILSSHLGIKMTDKTLYTPYILLILNLTSRIKSDGFNLTVGFKIVHMQLILYSAPSAMLSQHFKRQN